MKGELQVFTNLQKSFIFCDYNWQLSPESQTLSTANNPDIYFQKDTDVYLWECGCSTGAKLLEAYSLYGENFARYSKLGDSSFILYDSGKEIVIAARDFIGNYPLYYYTLPDDIGNVIFTFSMQALLTSQLVEPTVNYAKVVQYIDYDLYESPNNHTFYQHVYRLLPAQILSIDQEKRNVLKRYGQFDLEKYQSFTDEQYVDCFRELFIKSVKKQIDSYENIAASLSGGLDSSSVCSIAQSLKTTPINTYNFKANTLEAQEGEYVAAMIDKWPINHQTIQSTYSDYEAVKKITEQNAQPFFLFNQSIQLDFIKAARQKNCDLFLSGHWGDQVVSNGYEYIDELANAKDWKNLRESINQYFENPVSIVPADEVRSSGGRAKAARLYAISLLWRRLKIKKHWATIPATVWLLVRYFNCTIADFWHLFSQRFNQEKAILPPAIDQLILPEILAEKDSFLRAHPMEVLDLKDLVNRPATFAQKQYLRGVFRANEVYAQEEYFEIYRQNSMRSAQPFFDTELIELNLSVPLYLKFDKGRRRGTIRRALKDFLPEQIANRVTKSAFTSHHVALFMTFCEDFIANTPDDHPVWKIANKSVFDECIKILLDTQIPAERKYRMLAPVKRIIQVAIWLDYLADLKK